MVIVSACLAGIDCRYDGRPCPEPEVVDLYRSGGAIALCPEELGGLSTPRPRAFFEGGIGEDVLDGEARVVRANGEDVTRHFIRGAEAVLRVAGELRIKTAILKAGSPSCGKGRVYLGEELVPGNGVCAALLMRKGREVRVMGE